MSAEVDIVEISTEAERVVAWRLRTLLESGYPVELAETIADSVEVDLHRAVDLVASGCSPETAARILL